MDLLDELQDRIVPGDGAMGTALFGMGAPMDCCLEELCISNPDLVRGVHESYLGAGARLLRTNSFGANTVRLARHGMEHRVSELNWSAAQLARDTAKGRGVYIAGSVGPLGISSEEAAARGLDREAIFNEQIGALLDGGVRVIFLETFTDLNELLLAIYVKQSLHHCPVIASLACSSDGRLPDGTPLTVAFEKLRAAEADIVGLNCVNGPETMLQLFERCTRDVPSAAFPNGGSPEASEGHLKYSVSPEAFARSAAALTQLGARLIGGCCGIGREHISAMVEALAASEPR